MALCGEFWSSLPGQLSATSLCVKLAASPDPASVLFGEYISGKLGSASDAFPHKHRHATPPHPSPPPNANLRPNSRKNKRIYIKLGGCLKAVDIKYELFCAPSHLEFSTHHPAHLVHKTILNTIIFACQLKSLCVQCFLLGPSPRASTCDAFCFRPAVLSR